MLIPAEATVWTVGHSTRTFEDFLDLLQEHRIALLADVRHFPASARVPWTNREALAASLPRAGLAYEHLAGLGGYRKALADSANTGWRNASFRGYADYMATSEFAAALDRLIGLAKEHRTAVMCAEAVPWRCHRGLLSDALLARGVRVGRERRAGGTESTPRELGAGCRGGPGASPQKGGRKCGRVGTVRAPQRAPRASARAPTDRAGNTA